MSLAAASFEIERLVPSDVPQNVALSRSVGWKDVESEWRVLHAAADVRGVRHRGRVAVQGALGDYGTSATLAKMIVSSELQRKGLGARLLDDFLAVADARRIPVGLCATDQGRPLYASEPAVELDGRFSGCDRSRMLRARFAEASVACALAGEERGFGLATIQGEHRSVGPILAESEAGARSLLLSLFAGGSGPVRVDVPLQHTGLRKWLVELGLSEVSLRVEMARGVQRMPWQVAQRFALSTQAWG